MLDKKILYVNKYKYDIETFKNKLGIIEVGINIHLNKVQSYKYNVFDPENVVIVGKGPFAGGALFGSHRLTIVFRSPITRTIFASTIGGAGYNFVGTGLDGVAIEGKYNNPTLIFIKGNENDDIEVNFESIDIEDLNKIFNNYNNQFGLRALANYILDTYKDFILNNKARMLLVGPGSFKSNIGGIYSPVIDFITYKLKVEDWASRGGGGSVLIKSHNVLGIIYGGNNYKNILPVLRRFDTLNGIISGISKQSFYKNVLDSTVKYNYDIYTKSGGTFGGDYIGNKSTPSFNWNNLNIDDKIKNHLYNLLLNNFIMYFNENIISNFSFATCGEPCPVMCKKVDSGSRTVDYEPFNACGPILGIYKFEKAKKVLEFVDAYGYDAIEIGNIIGWLFDLLENGLLKPEELGLENKPCFDLKEYKLDYSDINAELAIKILKYSIEGNNNIINLILNEGIRNASKKLDEIYSDRIEKMKIKFEDLAVYIPFGKNGSITPNFYYSPGMFAPLAILGRYWTNYSFNFSEPEEYAKISIERALNEYLLDSFGICRFHRKWIEPIMQDLFKYIYNLDINLTEYSKNCYREIIDYSIKSDSLPQFWESKKVIQIFQQMSCKYGADEWCKKFSKDLNYTALQWWNQFFEYYIRYFNLDIKSQRKGGE